MKALRSLALALVAVFGITGCLQVEKIVKLRPDGSGTIEETVVISKAFATQMKEMTAGFGVLGGDGGGKPAAGGAAPSFNLMDEGKLKEAAAEMGEGVAFVSAKPVTTASGEGFTATYAFKDINTVKLSRDMNDAMPKTEGPGLSIKPKTGKQEEPITFEFVKGAPASLTVKLPPPDLAAKDEPKTSEPAQPAGGDEMAMMMMREMFKDMKMSASIEVAGKIAQTNAAFAEGSRVTLMEMDFNKVLANPEKFKALSKAQPKSLADAEALLKGVEGVKIETQPKVTVKFQ
jgi:hypothetical protein